MRACIACLRSKDAISFVGIFRIPGNSMDVEDAVRDLGGDMQPSEVLDPLDIETVATLMKKFLKRCKTCLDDPNARDLPVDQLKNKLDPLLLYVLDFLAEIDDNSEVNKMPAHNLATVFAPLYVEPDPSTDVVTFTQMQLAPFINKIAALIQERTAVLKKKREEEEDDDEVDGIVMIHSRRTERGQGAPRPVPVRGISYTEVVAASNYADDDDEQELQQHFWSCAC